MTGFLFHQQDYIRCFYGTALIIMAAACFVIKQVAEAISQTFHRPGDMVARYGGEEFAVIMSGTGLHDALAMAQAVRAAVEALGIPHGSSTVVPVVTLSLGVSAIKPQKEMSFDVLVAAADQALYHAKSRGRNQMQISVV
jgi:diguanylate cyclase (GGDEF)-like protein